MRKPKEPHVIASVIFAPRTNVGAMECSCGWTGVTTSFTAHQRSVGLTSSNVQSWRADEGTPVFNRAYGRR